MPGKRQRPTITAQLKATREVLNDPELMRQIRASERFYARHAKGRRIESFVPRISRCPPQARRLTPQWLSVTIRLAVSGRDVDVVVVGAGSLGAGSRGAIRWSCRW